MGKKILIGFWLLFIFSVIGYQFWYYELQYSMPTPVPANYHNVKTGAIINLGNKLAFNDNKPVFIHFFNPDCPCSKFNIPYFNSLVSKYGRYFNFAVVVKNNNGRYTREQIQEKFDPSVIVSFDLSIAGSCGVYSTPQAVILDNTRKLYYRGNYNRSRFCTDNSTNFAQMAMDSLLQKNENPVFSSLALKAYGCQLTYCNR